MSSITLTKPCAPIPAASASDVRLRSASAQTAGAGFLMQGNFEYAAAGHVATAAVRTNGAGACTAWSPPV